MADENIAYQNKDITSKMLAESFKGKSFRADGLDLPEVQNMPSSRSWIPQRFMQG